MTGSISFVPRSSGSCGDSSPSTTSLGGSGSPETASSDFDSSTYKKISVRYFDAARNASLEVKDSIRTTSEACSSTSAGALSGAEVSGAASITGSGSCVFPS